MRPMTRLAASVSQPPVERRRSLSGARPWLKSLAVLFKLRVVFLLWVAGLGGASLASKGFPGMDALLMLTLSGTLSAAGASAINQYLERERDRQMARTRQRPLPSGRIARPGWVLGLGTAMVLGAVALAWAFNPALALFVALGAAIYIGVYTLWLKPRTSLNIVIGGAAGSCAVLSGGAAAGAWSHPGVLTLALLVFLWTPVHFWSLALAYSDDYAQAGFPMLPLRVPARQAAAWIALHTLAVSATALILSAQPSLGWLYGLSMALATLRLMALTGRLLRSPERHRALALFIYSNVYLGWLLLNLILLSAWR